MYAHIGPFRKHDCQYRAKCNFSVATHANFSLKIQMLFPCFDSMRRIEEPYQQNENRPTCVGHYVSGIMKFMNFDFKCNYLSTNKIVRCTAPEFNHLFKCFSVFWLLCECTMTITIVHKGPNCTNWHPGAMVVADLSCNNNASWIKSSRGFVCIFTWRNLFIDYARICECIVKHHFNYFSVTVTIKYKSKLWTFSDSNS